jgi:Tol biopolymer transport system component
MSHGHTELGHRLRDVLHAEADSSVIDAAAAARRLDAELSRVDHAHRRVAMTVAGVAAAVAAVVVMVVHATGGSEPRPASPPGVHVPRTPEDRTAPWPFFLDLENGSQRYLPWSLQADSAGQDTGHDDFHYEVSPDGQQVTYICHGGDSDCRNQDSVVISSLDGNVSHRWPLPESYTTDRVSWSPDGTALAYTLHAHGAPAWAGVFVQDVASGRRVRLVDGRHSPSDPTGSWSPVVAFSADGRSVLFSLGTSPTARSWPRSDSWHVWSVPTIGGAPTRTFANAADPLLLPDGEYALLTSGSGDGSDLDLDNGSSRRTLVHSAEHITWQAASPDGSRIAYLAGDHVRIVEVATGETSTVIAGSYSPSWADDHTLLLSPMSCC